MFCFRDFREGGVRVDVAFTDSSLDLHARHPLLEAETGRLEQACGVRFATVHQVHGDRVVLVESAGTVGLHEPDADGQVTTSRGVGLMVRAADCVPVLLADDAVGVIGAVHAGRNGVALDVVTKAADRMRSLGADHLVAWIGPHVCGACYEVPEDMRADVVAAVPAAYAVTRDGTPSLDLGAGVRSQLEAARVEVVTVERCTREDPALHSYRRDGDRAGRLAGLVWMS